MNGNNNQSLVNKLNGIDYLDRDLNLTSDEKTLVTTMTSFEKLASRRGSGYVYIPSPRYENSCPVPFDMVIVNEAGLQAYKIDKNILTDPENVADFFEKYVTFYESKVLVNGVVQLNAIDLLISKLKYFQSQKVYTNNNELISENNLKKSIDFVNSLSSEDQSNYLDTNATLEKVSLQQAKMLFKKGKLSIDVEVLNQETKFESWLLSNDSFLSQIKINKNSLLTDFIQLKGNYLLNKSPTLFQYKTDCWRSLLSSDPKDGKGLYKNIMGFNNHNILYNGLQPKLKVIDYSKFINPKNNELKTVEFTDFLNQYKFSKESEFVSKLQFGIKIYLKKYLR